MKRAALLLPALLLAAGLTGCGGDDDPKKAEESSSAAPALSQADFLEQGNAICAAGNEEISTAADALGEAPGQEDIEGFTVDVLIPNVQGQHDAIDALGAPEGDEDTVDAILAALQDGIDALSDDPSLITQQDGDPFVEANQLASDYGLTECGS
jgi:hypothetical protein